MPRKRNRSRDPEIRFRNMLEAEGLPAMAGRSRLSLKATRPITESATNNPVRTDPPPLVFHWNGAVDNHIGVRNGPGVFTEDGTIEEIRFYWDTPPAGASDVSIEWEINGVDAFGTYTLGTGNPTTGTLATAYTAGDRIVGWIDAATSSTPSGLTVLVFLTV